MSATTTDPDVLREQVADVALKTYTLYFLVTSVIFGILLFVAIRKASKICCWQQMYGLKFVRDYKEDPRVPATVFRVPSVLNTLQDHYNKGMCPTSTIHSEDPSCGYVAARDIEYGLEDDKPRVHRYIDELDDKSSQNTEANDTMKKATMSTIAEISEHKPIAEDKISGDRQKSAETIEHQPIAKDTICEDQNMSDEIIEPKPNAKDQISGDRKKSAESIEHQPIAKDKISGDRKKSAEIIEPKQNGKDKISGDRKKSAEIIEPKQNGKAKINGDRKKSAEIIEPKQNGKDKINGDRKKSDEQQLNDNGFSNYDSSSPDTLSEVGTSQRVSPGVELQPMYDPNYETIDFHSDMSTETAPSTTSDVAPLVSIGPSVKDPVYAQSGRYKKNTSTTYATSTHSASGRLSKRLIKEP